MDFRKLELSDGTKEKLEKAKVLAGKAQVYVGPVAWVLLFFAVAFTFLSLNRASLGTEYLLFASFLTVWYYRKVGKITLPAMGWGVFAVFLLVISGRFGEIGFNAPVSHAMRFVYIFFAVTAAALVFTWDGKRKQVLLVTLGAVYALSCLISLYCVLFLNIYAIRYYEAEGFTQVLDFKQIYVIPLVLPVCVYYLLVWWKEPLYRWLLLGFSLLLVFTVYMSLLTFPMLLSALGIVLAAAVYLAQNHRKLFLRLCIAAAVVAVLCAIFRHPLSDLLYKLTENMNYLVRARLRSVIDMILGTQHDNWYEPSRRDELMQFSLNAFRSSPVFGVGYAGYAYGVIGGHQEWADMLGVFGGLGTFLFVAMMAYSFWCLFVRTSCREDKTAMLLCALMLLILGFLNPCLGLPQLLTVFLVAPQFSNLRRKQ